MEEGWRGSDRVVWREGVKVREGSVGWVRQRNWREGSLHVSDMHGWEMRER